MTYTTKAAPRARFDIDGTGALLLRKKRTKLARLLAIKRALHLLGFLCYWAIFSALFFLAFLVCGILFVCLA